MNVGPGFAAAGPAQSIVIMVGFLALSSLLGWASGYLAFHLCSLVFGAVQ